MGPPRQLQCGCSSLWCPEHRALPGELSTPQPSFPFLSLTRLSQLLSLSYPDSQVNEEKVTKHRKQGNFLLLILLFREEEAVSFFFPRHLFMFPVVSPLFLPHFLQGLCFTAHVPSPSAVS